MKLKNTPLESVLIPGFEMDLENFALKSRVAENPYLPIESDGTRQLRVSDILRTAFPGMPLPKAVERVAEEYLPALFRALYPRVYESACNYHSPRQLAAYLTLCVAEAIQHKPQHCPTSINLLLPALHPLVEKKMPMFFIASDLLRAIQQTDFDDDIDWTSMHLPYEHGIFILPRGGFASPRDGEVSAIIWSRILKDREYPLPFSSAVGDKPGAKIVPEVTAMSLIALCPDKFVFYDSTLTAKVRPTLRLRNLFYRAPGEPFPAVRRNNPFVDQPVEEEDADFLESVGVVAFGTLLAMSARPELVEHARLLHTAKPKPGKDAREFWSPNIIGRRYRAKREVPKVVDGKFQLAQREHGTHASPRMHWRRGHFRHQPCGPQRRERKVIWIEPCLIAATIEEEGATA